MKKKLLLALIALTCAFCLVFNLAGCEPAANNQSGNQQETPGGQGSGSSDSEESDEQGSGGSGSEDFGGQGSGGSGSEDFGGQGGGQQGGNSGVHVHNYGKLIPEQPATCKKEGLQAHYYCDVCKKYFDSEKHETTLEQLKIDIDLNAHSYGELIPEQPATCIAEGLQAHYYCDVCEKYFDSEKHETTLEKLKIDIDLNAHNYGELIPEQPATCTAEGLQAHYYCDVCEKYFDSEKRETTLEKLKIDIDLNAHNYGKLISEQPATCTAEGLQAHYYCEGCEKYFDSEKHETTIEQLKIDIDLNAHSYGELIPEQPATCTVEGMRAHYYCEGCEKYFDSEKHETTLEQLKISIDPNAHNYKFKCSQTEHWQVCTDCGEETAHSTHSVSDGVCPACGYVEKYTYGLEFTKVMENKEIIGYSVKEGTTRWASHIFIPSFYNNLPVLLIGYEAFYKCTNLTEITVGNNVISIDEGAFWCCESLTKITIPDSVTSIGKSAFLSCTSLKEITIPQGVTSIGNYAFHSCTSLEKITIPDSVTSIGDEAFWCCKSLIKITIGKSVTSIGSGAFSGCKSLEGVYINDIAVWCNIDFGDYYANPLCCAGNLYLKGQLVTNLEIPNSVTYIGGGAFSNCTSLKEITIPNSVTSIGRSAFYNCTSLKEITIPDSVTSIGSFAFSGCKSLTKITIPNSVTSIGSFAFYNCTSLTKITIPASVTSIGSEAFEGCTSLTEITIPDSVTSIGYKAFSGCIHLDEITIPNSITSIGELAFSSCTNLTEITIPDSVTSIGRGVFKNCTSLKEITIPDSITSIGGFAFYNTAYYNNADNWENDVLYIGNYLIKAKDTFSGSYQITPGTKLIADEAFYNCSSLTKITISDNVTSIGDEAFWCCESLIKITIGKSVTSIGDNAFWNCISLTEITIGKSVRSIGNSAFENCYRLTEITLPTSVTSIGSYAFKSCTRLERVIFENTAGWKVSSNSDMSNLSDINVEDPEQNANNLKQYYKYYWKRG